MNKGRENKQQCEYDDAFHAPDCTQLAYESKLLEFSKSENKTAAYLRLNPRGKIPTIKDGDFVLYESLAIMSYLDRKYPDPPLSAEHPRKTV